MTETNCDLFTHKSSRSYLNHLVCMCVSMLSVWKNLTRGVGLMQTFSPCCMVRSLLTN
jgi:hypothetical protein